MERPLLHVKTDHLAYRVKKNIMAEDCHFVLYVMVLSIKERELQ